MRLSFRALFTAGACSVLVACGGEEEQFSTRLSPGLASRAPHALSVFGAFRDGRMSVRAWDDIALKLVGMLGPEPCSALYGAELMTSEGGLASAIDDYTKNYGVSDALLAELAPAATGDLVLYFTISGATKAAKVNHPEPQRPPPGAMMRRSSFPARGPRHEGAGPYEIAAWLYSVPERTTVATLSLRYGGANEDEAVVKLDGRWRVLFPATTCGGWDFTAHPVQADAIRALPEP